MYKFFQIYKRDFLNLVLNPMWIFYCTVFPFLLVIILGFLSSGNYGSNVTSYDYYGITMIIFIVFNTSTIASNSFMEERIKKGNMRIIYSPVPKACIYISKIAATFTFSSVCHLFIMLLLNFIFNVNYGGGNTIFIVIIILLFEIFSAALGVMFCCILKEENTANQVLSIFINITALLGGVFFRLDGYGKAVEKLSYISPIKWIVTCMLKIIYDGNFSYYMPTVLILIILSLLTLLLCRKFYRSEDYI